MLYGFPFFCRGNPLAADKASTYKKNKDSVNQRLSASKLLIHFCGYTNLCGLRVLSGEIKEIACLQKTAGGF
jgi:hypothetical protein